MFEHLTVDIIFNRMLSHVDDKLDKRPGSLIWMALRPAAVEFRLHYLDLEMVMKNAFARTADREYLVKRAEESSIFPMPASSTKVEGRFNIAVPIGSRFNKEKHNFKVLEPIPDKGDGYFYFLMESEDKGVISDSLIGNIIPITTKGAADYVKNLELAEIISILRPGEDTEDTETFRARYFRENKWEHYGGNIADYEVMMSKITGVGEVKVIPVWDGPGTVKLVTIDSAYNIPSNEFLAEIKEEIDPAAYSGMGIGKAPINHRVTVVAPDQVKININLPITYEAEHRWETVEEGVKKTIESYLAELRRGWKNKDQLVVRIAFIESRVLDVHGVLDVQNVTLNGQASNIVIGQYELPILGEVTAT